MVDNNGYVFYYLDDHLGSTRLLVKEDGTIQDKYSRYLAFGADGGSSVVVDQKYRYTGKPFDEDGGIDIYYYCARYYDPLVGRFLAVDPMQNKYPEWSTYVYTLDNPIILIDPDGKEPGDPFKSVKGAAMDFGKTYLAKSIKEKKEYGSAIYILKISKKGAQITKTYSYNDPNVGVEMSGSISNKRGSINVAGVHTHPASDSKNKKEQFSTTDKRSAGNFQDQEMYVFTSDGKLFKYEKTKDKESFVDSLVVKETKKEVDAKTVDKDKSIWRKISDWFMNLGKDKNSNSN